MYLHSPATSSNYIFLVDEIIEETIFLSKCTISIQWTIIKEKWSNPIGIILARNRWESNSNLLLLFRGEIEELKIIRGILFIGVLYLQNNFIILKYLQFSWYYILARVC